jgi:hypothetical protein
MPKASDNDLPPERPALRRQNALPTTGNPLAYDLKHVTNADLVANQHQKLKMINFLYSWELLRLTLFGQLTSCKAESQLSLTPERKDPDADPDAGAPRLLAMVSAN